MKPLSLVFLWTVFILLFWAGIAFITGDPVPWAGAVPFAVICAIIATAIQTEGERKS